ncbi:MAG TPA: Rid family hydrolase [Rhodanobacteraceae bacterium]|jgi:2-iminobutanoate/2-iminopropanoate deaminase|nr:Rid family hydrolase [Rhodanobacteraceae bacterium]
MNGWKSARRRACVFVLSVISLAAAHAAEPARDGSGSDSAAQIQFNAKQNAPPGMTLPFSESVRAGDMLYLSGEVGIDASGKLVAGGIKAEAKQVMDNIGADLARQDSSFDRVVQCTVALADIADWPAFNDVYRGYFKEHFPARMAFAASALALGARVEVQCNAVAGKKR